MGFVETYSRIEGLVGNAADFSLIEIREGLFEGVDQNGNLCIVVKSSDSFQREIRRNTELVSIECNIEVDYLIESHKYHDTVHIIKCLSRDSKDRELFIEVADILISESECHDYDYIETFNALAAFFKDKRELSDIELIGLYAELFFIKKYQSKLNIARYWQTTDRERFDFSISDQLKIEIKSTIKPNRIHHFRHEQLMTSVYTIIVISYMLKHDDMGLSLFDLILTCKNYFSDNKRMLLKLEGILKNTSEERLKSIKFSEPYTNEMERIVHAEEIPRFQEKDPAGVFRAEYDSDLENCKFIDACEFVNTVSFEHGAENEQ